MRFPGIFASFGTISSDGNVGNASNFLPLTTHIADKSSRGDMDQGLIGAPLWSPGVTTRGTRTHFRSDIPRLLRPGCQSDVPRLVVPVVVNSVDAQGKISPAFQRHYEAKKVHSVPKTFVNPDTPPSVVLPCPGAAVGASPNEHSMSTAPGPLQFRVTHHVQIAASRAWSARRAGSTTLGKPCENTPGGNHVDVAAFSTSTSPNALAIGSPFLANELPGSEDRPFARRNVRHLISPQINRAIQ